MKDYTVLYMPPHEAMTKGEHWAEYVTKTTGIPTIVLPTGFELVQMAGDLELE